MRYAAVLTRVNARETLKDFLRWWGGELLSFVPPAVQRYFRSRQTLIIVDLRAASLAIGQVALGKYKELASVATCDDQISEPTTEVRGALQNAVQAGAKIVLRLRRDQVLRKSIEFPLSAERDLRRILALELDLHTPATSKDAVFDFRVVRRNVKTKRLTVELAVVRRDTLTQALMAIASLGLEVSVVGIPSGEGVLFNFASATPQNAGGAGRRIVVGALAATAAVLFAIATDLEVVRKNEAARELAKELATQKALSDDVARLKNDIAEKARLYQFMPSRKQLPLTAVVLNEVARVLPDDTWIFQFDLRDRQARLVGFSAASSKLVGLIDQSPLFANARFPSPVTQTAGRNIERFELTFEVRQGVDR